ncbi:NAD-dependent epimerase/dehydratase family protein [Staphylococcus aureus]|nr:NAD-dependent epimerase/dehydratase family protein [Staphylococcus aureus]
MRKNILITGMHGYIGNALKNKLTEQGHRVNQINVRNQLWKSTSFRDYDVLIHTAALVHNNTPKARLSDYMQVNMLLTKQLAQKAKDEGIKQFIFMSTMAVYGKEGNVGKIDEIGAQTPIKPTTNYGISKMFAEQALLEMVSDTFKVAIVRPPMIYGPHCPGNFQRLMRLSQLLPIIPVIKNQRSALYIKHLTAFIDQLISLEVTGVYHPQDSFYFDTSAVMHEIRHQTHRKTVLIHMPSMLNKYFNKLSVFRKLFGNLTYSNTLYENNNALEVIPGKMSLVIADIMDETTTKGKA